MPLRNLLAALAAAFALPACCGSGAAATVLDQLATLEGPHLVVYYPDHDTWNTPFMSTVVELDGEPIGRLCEGDVLTVPVSSGLHVLTTSRDDESGCGKAIARPKDGWPPLELEVGDAPVLLRYGAEPVNAQAASASICYRRLMVVEAAALVD